MDKTRDPEEWHWGKLITLRAPVCRQCGEMGTAMQPTVSAPSVRKDIVPAFKAKGWQYNVPGGWICPDCVAWNESDKSLKIHG